MGPCFGRLCRVVQAWPPDMALFSAFPRRSELYLVRGVAWQKPKLVSRWRRRESRPPWRR